MNAHSSFQKQGFWKKRSLGQNFIVNAGILEKVVKAADLNKDDIVLEIGPGTGNLTKKLSEKVEKVVAIEKDFRLIESLKEAFKNSNVEIIKGDVLKVGDNVSRSLASGRSYKVVGNIPYYITSNLLRTIFEKWSRFAPRPDGASKSRIRDSQSESGPTPKLIVLMVQKEVAQRIVAKPPHMNLLALSVQFYSEPKIISHVSRGSFRPMPKVDSAIIKLTPRDDRLSAIGPEQFFKLIKTAFVGKRKQLAGNLSKKFGIMVEELLVAFKKIDIKPNARAENLSLDQWLKLAEYLKKYLN